MERKEVLDWLTDHPLKVYEAPEALLRRCEAAVQEQVHEEAWMRACALARDRERYWRDDGGGCQASEAFVADEVCADLAVDLRRREPAPQAQQIGAALATTDLTSIDVAGRSLMLSYLLELARREEHRTWLAVMDFTRARGRNLAREDGLSGDHDHERTRPYAETAARVMHRLAADLEARAHPRAG